MPLAKQKRVVPHKPPVATHAQHQRSIIIVPSLPSTPTHTTNAPPPRQRSISEQGPCPLSPTSPRSGRSPRQRCASFSYAAIAKGEAAAEDHTTSISFVDEDESAVNYLNAMPLSPQSQQPPLIARRHSTDPRMLFIPEYQENKSGNHVAGGRCDSLFASDDTMPSYLQSPSPVFQPEQEHYEHQHQDMLPETYSILRCGSKFRGFQRSGKSRYRVEVELHHVDLAKSFMCGYLNITGLTEDHENLTTYFDAEMIGPDHSFMTGKWDASEKSDREHWSKFSGFKKHRDAFMRGAPCLTSPLTSSSDCIFMRWKEHFLVPDHNIKTLTGASFAGFYYICLNKRTNTISGYYYHNTSEMFQELTLDYVSDQTFESFDFC